ncbi:MULTISPECIES: hypothetical protein [Nocardia]|uniref:hypothetical protein n=1 Tax=Nocardia TaxID=1817 RepID=UPI002457B460|nr:MULTISPECIES: hypothetical protein [Nocardia]
MSHLFTLAREPQQTLTLPDLPCGDCGRPRELGLDTGVASCATSWCAAAVAICTPLWRLIDAAGIDRNPAGHQRPTHRGLPIPWITPVTEGPHAQLRLHWRMIHRGRLAAAQRYWLCQHCGLAADRAAAIVVVDDSGYCLTPAPLHPHCADTSVSQCPHLTRTAATVVIIARGREQRHGQVASEIGLTEDWTSPVGLF